MSQNYCTLGCYTHNKEGKVVESKLWKDLLHYTNKDRKLTKKLYAISKSQKFLNLVKDKATFDENGELTISSLLKLSNMSLEKESLLETLNKDIKSGVYNYETALKIVQEFNSSNDFNDSYMATLEQKGTNYEVKVVEKSAYEKDRLKDTINKKTIQDKIIEILRRNGVNVEFLDEENQAYNGKYSTVNAEKNAENLYNLIKIVKGREDITDTLIEEAAHFAVASLGRNNSLVDRLEKALTDDVIGKILSDESITLGTNKRREVCGKLVAQAIQGRSEFGYLSNLANRIWNNIKYVYHTLTLNDVKANIDKAKLLADKIASGFLNGNNKGTIENAINETETLYSDIQSENISRYRELVNTLTVARTELESLSSDLTGHIDAILLSLEGSRNNLEEHPQFIADGLALQGIAEGIKALNDLYFNEIPSKLASVDFTDVGFNQKMSNNSKTLREVRCMLTYSMLTLQSLQSSAISIQGIPVKLRGDLKDVILSDNSSYNLKAGLDSLGKILNNMNSGIYADLCEKERALFALGLEDVYGSSYIKLSASTLFGRKSRFLWGTLKTKESKVTFEELTKADTDISLFERFLSSMSNVSDIVLQMADKVNKESIFMANQMTITTQDKLRALQVEFQTLGINTRDLMEKDPVTGKFTGYFIDEYNYGIIAREWEEYREETIENFKKNNPDWDTWSDIRRGEALESVLKTAYKIFWYKGDSTRLPVYDDKNRKDAKGNLLPSTRYYNDAYLKLANENPKAISILNKLKDIKAESDEKINSADRTAAATAHNRLPQFRGDFVDRVRTISHNSNIVKATLSTLRTDIVTTFCEDALDEDYGSNVTYNSKKDGAITDTDLEKEQIHRLPVFGINRLKNMDELSTDLFSSLLAYDAMANSYLAKSKVVDFLEIGKNIIGRRNVRRRDFREYKGNVQSKYRGKDTKAYAKYVKFLEMQMYSKNVDKMGHLGIIIGNKRVLLSKFLSFCTMAASKTYLGGNIKGGMVNLGTGILEIAKEALTGEFIKLPSILKANKLYLEQVAFDPKNIINVVTAKDFQDDKIHLLIKHFDILGSGLDDMKNWDTKRSRFTYFLWNKSLFYPYRAGEVYMQTMSYLATLIDTKVYDEDGNAVSLYDAYKRVENKDTYGNVNGYTLKLDKQYYISYNSIDIINKINNIYTKISTSGIITPINFTDEELSFLSSIGITTSEIANLNSSDVDLKNQAKQRFLMDLTNIHNSHKWNTASESKLADRCRQLNNRMHGIYNKSDAVSASQNMFIKMILSMKGYALGMLSRRISSSRHDVTTNQEIEGSWLTVFKFIADRNILSKDMYREVGMLLRGLFMPFGKGYFKMMKDAGFNKNQAYNMRRNLFDCLFMTMMILLSNLTSIPGDDGDDDDDYYIDEEGHRYKIGNRNMGILHYFFSRLAREQGAYTLYGYPLRYDYLKTEWASIAAINGVGISVLFDYMELANLYMGAQFNNYDPDINSTEDSGQKYFYRQTKIGYYDKGDPKYLRKFYSMCPWLKDLILLDNPYAASEGYDYGKVSNFKR